MKKFLSLIMAAMLVLSTSVALAVDESTKASWVPDENKTYTYNWTYYQMEPLADKPFMLDFYRENFNTEFNVWEMDSVQYKDLVAQRIIGGEIPDRFEVDTSTMLKYAQEGVLAEIPMEMLEIYAPDLLEAIERDVPGALEYCKVDGKLYGLPKYSMGSVARAPVVFRADWLKAVGIEKAPETLDEFEEAIYAFTFNDPDGNGKNDTYGISNTGLMALYGAYGYLPYVDSQGAHLSGHWTEKDGKLVFGAVQPEMKDALARAAKWYADGVVDPEFVTGENQGGYWALSHAFINGRIGVTCMAQTYHWAPAFFEGGSEGACLAELHKLNPEAEVVMVDPPVGPYGKSGVFANNPYNQAKTVFGVQLEQEPDKLAKILSIYNWVVSSYDNFNTASTGFEGTHWEYQEQLALDGIVDKSVVQLEPYKSIKNFMNINFAHTAMSVFTPSFKDREQPASIRWALSVNADKYRIYNELLIPLESEILYKADLDSLVEQTYYSIISGAQSVDEFDAFVKQWLKLGGEEMTTEANAWYATIAK